MKGKKHIDKLFQDRFKDFDATPPPEVWANIQAQLKKEKEDRKVIPIWWRVAGIAALLALLLTVGNAVFDFGGSTTELTDEKITIPENIENDNLKPILESEENKGEIVSEDDSESKEAVESDKSILSNDKSKNAVFDKVNDTETSVATETSIDKKKKSAVDNLIIKDKVVVDPSEKADVVTNTSEKKISEDKKTEKTTSDKIIADKVMSEKIASEKTIKDKANNSKDPLIKDADKVTEKTSKDAVASEKTVEKAAETVEEEKKKSIFDAIAENESEDKEVKNPTPDNRWEVSPNVGPVYYSSLGNGSSIDPSFADNAQSGDVNFSYGAGVSYAISNRLSIRSGISNVNLSYTTGDVELGTGPVSAALKSVDYGGRQQVVTAVDKGTLNSGPDNGDPFSNITPKAAGAEAFINQSIRYYEVPLELNYAIVDNKFGINMIGGFSTLFLGANEISVNAGDFSTVLGEANNLNSLSFTTNIGLGFNYKISKRLKFNIEPMFKYQLNPYTDSSVDFNPFYMGVYTGFSFKF